MTNFFQFRGGPIGRWNITDVRAVTGASLVTTDRLDVVNGDAPSPLDAAWVLRGVTSNLRYATSEEVTRLRAIQPAIGRDTATCAALIPIKKSAAWWDLAQDQRRAIFEESSRHNSIGMDYLPAIARRLHHCRDLGGPFEFLTWFEFAPDHAAAFDELLHRLRQTEEWRYVEREVEIRVQL